MGVVQKAREQNYPLSGPIVQAKATEFAQTLGVVDQGVQWLDDVIQVPSFHQGVRYLWRES